ncbi:TetR/AcrR family transcriptional regulator [Miniphocaeibacter halophilus]|uniref:TetR/AcrR family transcriptional regulator n=1 Tax=Miniphocaeibacter halophilus TaxID=2931922 RepID=A0AC61N0I5_9FIRM|nr:TetR/AcrR family transcriptional regulator [Miniphocaeibacter halophilus]QQK08821.1 TetR/AcrR family transcriptional regulator [Miniphocaeibacter halophilus]
MTTSRKNFTSDDKRKLKAKLRKICSTFWVERGYKETSISEFCKYANISTGSFYNLYSSKEKLFFETLQEVQFKVNEKFIKDVKNTPSKGGFAEALENLYFEYESKPFLYDTKAIDFQAFYNKLSIEEKTKLESDNSDFFRQAINHAKLKLKCSEEVAFSVFSILLSTVSSKEMLSKSCDFEAAFKFMVQNLVEDIFI